MKNNHAGFTLVEIMIAAGLLGGLSLFFIQMLQNADKSKSYVESSITFQQTLATTMNILNRPELCKVAFKNSAGTNAKFSVPPNTPPTAAEKFSKLYLSTSPFLEIDKNLEGGIKIFVPPDGICF